MSDVEYWKDRYYEQQADFTESNGMLHQERDNAIKRAEKAECEAEALRDALEAWEGTHCGGDCLADPCATCDGTRNVPGKGVRLEREVADERAIVDRVWKALAIATYEEAAGKAIDEHVAGLRREVAALREALGAIIRHPESTDAVIVLAGDALGIEGHQGSEP